MNSGTEKLHKCDHTETSINTPEYKTSFWEDQKVNLNKGSKREKVMVRWPAAGLDSLGQVSRKDLPGIFAQILLEDGGQSDHGFSGAQL